MAEEETLYVIEIQDRIDEPWRLDFNIPHHYLQKGVAENFHQVFGFIFNGKEDADTFLVELRERFSHLIFRIREAVIITSAPGDS